jgi:hypothetical protein
MSRMFGSSASDVANVTGCVQLGHNESCAAVPSGGSTGEHQTLPLGDTRRAAHVDVRSALNQAALFDRALDLLGVEIRRRSRRATSIQSETHCQEEASG